MIEFKSATIDNRYIAYTNQTKFLVQVRKHGAYKTRYSFTGDLTRAVMFYNAINVGNGYTKRLYCEGFNKPVLAKRKGVCYE